MTLHDLVRKLYPKVIQPLAGEIYIDCPFCVEEAGKKDFKQRLGLNTASGIGHCHRCEKKHSAKGGRRYWFKELCRVFNVSYQIDSTEKDNEQSEPTAARHDKSEDKKPATLPPEFEPLWRNVDDRLGRKARCYLLERGVTREQIHRHRIGFCAVGQYALRIIFPVYSASGKLKAFVGRDITGNSKYKYLNSEGAKTLYNVPKKRRKTALLAEGIFDVYSIERANLSVDPVAGLGKTLPKPQLRLLAKYDNVTIWPDPDRAGVEGAIKRAVALGKKKVNVSIVLPDEDLEIDTDLGNMSRLEIRQRYAERVPYSSSVAALMRVRVAHAVTPKRKKKFIPEKEKRNDD